MKRCCTLKQFNNMISNLLVKRTSSATKGVHRRLVRTKTMWIISQITRSLAPQWNRVTLRIEAMSCLLMLVRSSRIFNLSRMKITSRNRSLHSRMIPSMRKMLILMNNNTRRTTLNSWRMRGLVRGLFLKAMNKYKILAHTKVLIAKLRLMIVIRAYKSHKCTNTCESQKVRIIYL